jgi:L-iditol 2-dehydrogenase
MKALVYEGPWQLALREVPVASPGPGELRVAVRACGICGSDVHGYTGSTGRRTPPLVMGHEVSGTVDAVGDGVDAFRAGDRVVLRSIDSCGECDYCRAGNASICGRRRGLGVVIPGGYAESLVLPASMAVRMPDEMTFDEGALVEPLSVAMHAVNLSPRRLMGSVAIVGAGTIGLLALLAVRLAGAGTVVVTDRVPRRLSLALELGADVAVNVDEEDPVAAVRRACGGSLAELVFEAVGLDATSRQSLALVRPGGNVTWIGNSDPMVSLSMQEIVTRELTLRGAYGANEEFEGAIESIRSGRVPAGRLVDRVAPLEEGPALFEALATAKLDATKIVLAPQIT